MIKVSDALRWIRDNVDIVGADDVVSENCGITTCYITPKQLERLKDGKAIYFDDGEYAHLIIMRSEDK